MVFALTGPWLACARTVPVEAPMVASSAASASIVAARPPSGTARPDDGDELPFHQGERLLGTYVCAQGKTSLTFVVEGVRTGADEGVYLDVTFSFEYDGGTSGASAVEGSARMKGTFDPRTRRLRLHAEDWIDQPSSYQLVDFAGTVTRTGVYSGRVEGPGCTTFTAAPDRSDDNP